MKETIKRVHCEKEVNVEIGLSLLPFKHNELPAPITSDPLVPAPFVAQTLRSTKTLRDQVIRATQILREVEELRVVAKLLEDVDGCERL